jgi:8-oxo-dGTP diphosphatase
VNDRSSGRPRGNAEREVAPRFGTRRVPLDLAFEQETGPSHEGVWCSGEVAAATAAPLQRFETTLPGNHTRIGGDAVLEEVQSPSGSQDSVELAQHGRRDGDSAQRERQERPVAGAVCEWQRLTVTCHALDGDPARRDAPAREPLSHGCRLDGEHHFDFGRIVLDVEPRPEADLDDTPEEALRDVGPPRSDHGHRTGPVDQAGQDLCSVEAHCDTKLARVGLRALRITTAHKCYNCEQRAMDVPHPTTVIGCSNVIVDHGRYLLVQESKPLAAQRYNLPAGKPELGETLAEAAAREAREETGLLVVAEDLVAIFHAPWTPEGVGVVNFIFRSKVVGGELRASSEHPDVRYFSREEIAALGRQGSLRGIHIELAIDRCATGARLPPGTVQLIDVPAPIDADAVADAPR